jgi:hypothetical protein
MPLAAKDSVDDEGAKDVAASMNRDAIMSAEMEHRR